MIQVADLPAINASLNATSAALLCVGYRCIRRGNKEAHRACMIGAFSVSTLFLVSYVIYHIYHGATEFAGRGIARPIYFFILITHTVLATAVVPMVLMTMYRAARKQFDKHKRIARWTWPIWVYVSVTGVVVYWMLYHLFPAR